MGFLAAYYLETTRFTKDELQHLMSLVRQASIAIEKNHLFAEAQRRAREMSALAEIGRDVSASLDLPNRTNQDRGHAKELLNANSSAVYVPTRIARPFMRLQRLVQKLKKSKATRSNRAQVFWDRWHSPNGEIINNARTDRRALKIVAQVSYPSST